MTDLKNIWVCAVINFNKWSVTPRMYTIAAIIAAFMIWLFSWLSDYVDAVGVAVTPWVFPFMLTTPVMMIIYGCLTALFYCDAPFTDSHTPFLAIRTSRRIWIIGQILYIVFAGFIYTAFFVFMSMLALFPNVQFSADWGAVLKTIAYDPASMTRYGIENMVNIEGQIISLFSAIEAMLISFGLFWLVSIFIGVLILCGNIVFGGMSGLIAAGLFTFIAYFSIYVGNITHGNILFFLSPLNWSSMYYLNWGGMDKFPTPIYAVSCLMTSIVVMSVVAVVVFCKRDMDIRERRL
ncbi:hypothetical protein [Paenibacillus arenosi]|uniref:ABC transporter permease n=1 Tax=Paenibacillus arenosi TaxID=2774142 RepID=A0ABR9AZD0_9BACL|nr:hypothetical protein [Paenibacillus arenosi]MBD8499501.1 hypothetical protein [Paenibacillus arenosi]